MITVCAIPPICVECERKYANVGKMITNTSPVSTRQDLTTANGHNSDPVWSSALLSYLSYTIQL